MNSYILSIKFLFFFLFLVDKNEAYKESSKFDTSSNEISTFTR